MIIRQCCLLAILNDDSELIYDLFSSDSEMILNQIVKCSHEIIAQISN